MGNPIAYHRIRTEKGTYEVPIFSIDDPDILDKSFRIMTHKGIGCYDLVDSHINPSLPLRVCVDYEGVSMIKAVNGIVSIVKPLSINSATPLDSAALITVNNSEYFQIRTSWAGTGLVMPMQLIPNKHYEIAIPFEVINNYSGQCFAQASIWNNTKNQYVGIFATSNSTVGNKQYTSGRFITSNVDLGDSLYLELFHASDYPNDIQFEFRIYKECTITIL